jgi:hypothetical protein
VKGENLVIEVDGGGLVVHLRVLAIDDVVGDVVARHRVEEEVDLPVSGSVSRE